MTHSGSARQKSHKNLVEKWGIISPHLRQIPLCAVYVVVTSSLIFNFSRRETSSCQNKRLRDYISPRKVNLLRYLYYTLRLNYYLSFGWHISNSNGCSIDDSHTPQLHLKGNVIELLPLNCSPHLGQCSFQTDTRFIFGCINSSYFFKRFQITYGTIQSGAVTRTTAMVNTPTTISAIASASSSKSVFLTHLCPPDIA